MPAVNLVVRDENYSQPSDIDSPILAQTTRAE
jgi:hypothetical protein